MTRANAGMRRGMLVASVVLLAGLVWAWPRLFPTLLAWEQGLNDDPDHAPLLLELGRLALEVERYEEAAWLGGRAAQRPGGEARGDLLLGQVRAAQGDPEAAVAC